MPPKLAFDLVVAQGFFAMVRSLFDGPMVVEPRHASWFTAESDSLLQACRIARAGADPPRADGGLLPGGYRGLTYMRMHGAPRMYFSL